MTIVKVFILIVSYHKKGINKKKMFTTTPSPVILPTLLPVQVSAVSVLHVPSSCHILPILSCASFLYCFLLLCLFYFRPGFIVSMYVFVFKVGGRVSAFGMRRSYPIQRALNGDLQHLK